MLKGTGNHSTEACHVLLTWMKKKKKRESAGNPYVQRQISFKKEFKVEDLKILNPCNTLCPKQSCVPRDC